MVLLRQSFLQSLLPTLTHLRENRIRSKLQQKTDGYYLEYVTISVVLKLLLHQILGVDNDSFRE